MFRIEKVDNAHSKDARFSKSTLGSLPALASAAASVGVVAVAAAVAVPGPGPARARAGHGDGDGGGGGGRRWKDVRSESTWEEVGEMGRAAER